MSADLAKRSLGTLGPEVSVVGLGCNNFGRRVDVDVTRAVVDAIQADAGLTLPELRVDGGMTANGFLMQTQADLLGVPVVRPSVAETTARGAAFLAGLTAGVWDGVGALAALGEADTRWEPRLGADERDRRYADWQAAVTRVRTQ